MSQPNLHNVSALRRVLVREGVALRPLAVSDAAVILGILSEDPSIRDRVWIASVMRTAEDVAQQVAAAQKDETLIRYVIVEHDIVVGMMTFWRAGEYFGDKADPDDYGFGYFLAPSARGRGLVTDSLTALMNIAIAALGATSFVAFCEADNAASGAVLKKAGLEPTAETWTEPDHGWVERKYSRII